MVSLERAYCNECFLYNHFYYRLLVGMICIVHVMLWANYNFHIQYLLTDKSF